MPKDSAKENNKEETVSKHRFPKKLWAKIKKIKISKIFKTILCFLKKAIIAIFKFILVSIILGFILNLIGKYLFPELKNKIPNIFVWCDGCLYLLDFTFKMLLKAITSFFVKDVPFFLDDAYWNEWRMTIQRFISWLHTL